MKKILLVFSLFLTCSLLYGQSVDSLYLFSDSTYTVPLGATWVLNELPVGDGFAYRDTSGSLLIIEGTAFGALFAVSWSGFDGIVVRGHLPLYIPSGQTISVKCFKSLSLNVQVVGY